MVDTMKGFFTLKSLYPLFAGYTVLGFALFMPLPWLDLFVCRVGTS